jgi:protocatechuate 3,4-dioxygenase alpha subunit
VSERLTPAQTVGPYFAIELPWADGQEVVADGIRIAGRVLDGAGEPVPDALVETWQAEGFGRCATDGEGRWWVRTAKPARLDDEQAPHIAVLVFARGLLHRIATRIYFADEEQANATDPVLRSLPADRAATLLARPSADGYDFDIFLQAHPPDHETTFFAI